MLIEQVIISCPPKQNWFSLFFCHNRVEPHIMNKVLTVPSRRTHSGKAHGAPLVSQSQVASCPLLHALPVLFCEQRFPITAVHSVALQLSAAVPGREQAHSRWMTWEWIRSVFGVNVLLSLFKWEIIFLIPHSLYSYCNVQHFVCGDKSSHMMPDSSQG